jgi:hypothetical protein
VEEALSGESGEGRLERLKREEQLMHEVRLSLLVCASLSQPRTQERRLEEVASAPAPTAVEAAAAAHTVHSAGDALDHVDPGHRKLISDVKEARRLPRGLGGPR